ncbi:MAG: DNA-directed RNA polymerase subunit delta [Bacilli bacterium]|nr:DNA-directed RNA polymerase subunit delta [Bacilli bacterium]MDD4076597.1 DNA-directed RNA polymerase subunit delta [Bacilli bacterium]MDD4387704.1 DNA-directed RNA polymerase subunit delta [Bacilli bacterium]
MNNNNLSLIEIAYREMKTKRKPRTLEKIAKDVFEIKGIHPNDTSKIMSQFVMDFMLSGYFICCGEDKHGKKLWDLKSRQKSSLLDKDGSYLEDLYNDDDEAIKHELNDDIVYKPGKSFDDVDYDIDDDEDEETEEETDDVEELISEEYGNPEEESEYADDDFKDESDEIDVEEDDYEDGEEDVDDE